MLSRNGKVTILVAGIFFLAAVGCYLFYYLRPVAAVGSSASFTVSSGQGFRSVAAELQSRGFIRSAKAFDLYVLLTGRARRLKPGHYELNPATSGAAISATIAAGPEVDTAVTIPEGLTAVDIDKLLSDADVTEPGEFLKLVREKKLEGRLFPDTYRFYFNSTPQAVVDRFLENFNKIAAPVLAEDPANAERNLILASILEKEVPDYEDRRIVAGLLIKRAKIGMALQVDASICYAKEFIRPDKPCEPITSLDKKIQSPYNTYLNSGWPPGAIANPGFLAIKATLHPVDSPYWYYLSDPASGKTIFEKNINEQVANQLKYLNQN